MRLIFRSGCFFYRRDPERNEVCAAKKKCCAICPLYLAHIEGLTFSEHMQLAFTRNAAVKAFWFSVLSLIVSGLSTYYNLLRIGTRK